MRDMVDEAAGAAQLLKLLGNKHRLLILCCLMISREMTVGEIVSAIGLSQSALSQHLARLRADGLVEFRRTSQVLHYRIVDGRAARIIELLKDLYCGTAT
ncbi:MAG TPA: metalloregulator ArsR/SmtB family transcription factor [Alphaproteobacteria bacterium]|nr:metalloregulator ArsR/SmtB family transcription factor [Alphaproteobacteria bacterium]